MAVLFANTKSIYPKRFASSWEQLKELLSLHEENPVKAAGALWSPVEYDAGTTRGNRNVRFVEAVDCTNLNTFITFTLDHLCADL